MTKYTQNFEKNFTKQGIFTGACYGTYYGNTFPRGCLYGPGGIYVRNLPRSK